MPKLYSTWRYIAQAWILTACLALAYGLYYDGYTAQAVTHLFMALTLIGLIVSERHD